MTTPAEQKEKTRETKSILVNILLASMMIGLSLISSFFEFDTLASKIVMAAVIIAATLLGIFLLVRWLKSIDEYERSINARASMIALYSSLIYLPFQYLSEIELIPEINIVFLFMYIWMIYLVAMIFIVRK